MKHLDQAILLVIRGEEGKPGFFTEPRDGGHVSAPTLAETSLWLTVIIVSSD